MAVTFYFNNSKIQIFNIFSGTLDEIVQMHSHTKHGYELHLIDAGKGFLDTENKRYNLSKNVLYVTGPHVLHKQTPDLENPMHELCVYLEIPNTKNTDITVQYFSKQRFWIGKSNAAIRQIFKQMNEENEKESLWKESVLSSLAIRLIIEMTRLYYPDNTNALLPPQDTDLNESRSWILDQLLLEDCSNVKLEDFARGMGVCPRQAERIIKNYYGSSFKKLRYESKMAKAATMLEREDISIEECSARCGYSSFTAFSAAFKRKYKMTPKEYQKRYKA
ncbi:MAG: AraC family transcriptional regulator [Eubacterium sp.]|nr:AraC family transcriptional regulator [Eubacterium sp.]